MRFVSSSSTSSCSGVVVAWCVCATFFYWRVLKPEKSLNHNDDCYYCLLHFTVFMAHKIHKQHNIRDFTLSFYVDCVKHTVQCTPFYHTPPFVCRNKTKSNGMNLKSDFWFESHFYGFEKFYFFLLGFFSFSNWFKLFLITIQWRYCCCHQAKM